MFTKRNISLIVAALVLAGYIFFNFLRQEALKREADQTALKLAQVPEKVSTEDLSRYFENLAGKNLQ